MEIKVVLRTAYSNKNASVDAAYTILFACFDVKLAGSKMFAIGCTYPFDFCIKSSLLTKLTPISLSLARVGQSSLVGPGKSRLGKTGSSSKEPIWVSRY